MVALFVADIALRHADHDVGILHDGHQADEVDHPVADIVADSLVVAQH